MVFRCSLSDSKSPQVSRTLLTILANLKNALVWIVITRPLISKSTSSFMNHFLTVSITAITTGITVMFLFFLWFSSRY